MPEPIRIMLVEDHAGYRDVITRALARSREMELVSKFSTAETALRSIQPPRKEDPPDLVLLDLNLPGMSGLETIPWIQKYSPGTKVIILTQSDKEDDILRAITMGVEGYLLKSATVAQIKEGIRTVMDGGASLDPGVAKLVLQHMQPLQGKVDPEQALSPREMDILNLLADGLVKKQIAEQLGITVTTVAFHVRNIYDKLGVQNAPSAIAKAYKSGIIK